MAAINCKRCGHHGQAAYSENENPVHGDGFDQEVESVPEGFEIRGKKVFCSECRVEV